MDLDTAKVRRPVLVAFFLFAGGAWLLRPPVIGPQRWEDAILPLMAIVMLLVRRSVDGAMVPRGLFRLDTSFLIATFFLCGRHWAAGLSVVLILVDFLLQKTAPPRSTRNLAELSQTLLALAAMDLVWISLRDSNTVESLYSWQFLAALVAALAYSATSQLALTALLWCDDRRPEWVPRRRLSPEAAMGEMLGLFVSLATLVLWSRDPFLSLLVMLPIWVLFILLQKIHREKSALRRRQEELDSLQQLGLQIGSQLETQALARTIVRICTRALDAQGSCLIRWEHEAELLHFIETDVPVSGFPIPCARPHQELARRTVQGPGLIENAYVMNDPRYPELLGFLPGRFIAYPLGTHEPWGLLLVYASPLRPAFQRQDLHKLDTLSNFVSVAVRNALLVEQLHAVQEMLSQTEKMSALGQLVSGVAHEINNPLAGIYGCAQMALELDPPPHVKKRLEVIETESQRAIKIVRNLLTFSRSNTPEFQFVQLNEAIERVVALLDYDLQGQRIRVRTFLDPNLPQSMADYFQIQQVLINLINNAADAMHGTGQEKELWIRSGIEDQKIFIDVEDSGPGIPIENQRRVFDFFYTTKERGKGTGLGLSISYGIMQQHHGQLRILRSSPEGTVFRVELPITKEVGVRKIGIDD